MNFDRLRFVAERADLGEAREAVFAATIPERPGSFKEFCSLPRAEQHHRVQLPLRRSHRGPRLRRAERARPRGEGQAPARPRARGDHDSRSHRQRAREAPRAPPGRRAGDGAERGAVPVRVPRAARRADAVPRRDEPGLEHQPLPLPQPRCRLRPRPRGHPGAAGREAGVPGVPAASSATPTSRRRAIPQHGCS